MKHQWVKHESCKDCTGPPGLCPICDGGLARCAVCGLAEGALTTDCPGKRCSELADVIYKGAIDYVNGEWVMTPYAASLTWRVRIRSAVDYEHFITEQDHDTLTRWSGDYKTGDIQKWAVERVNSILAECAKLWPLFADDAKLVQSALAAAQSSLVGCKGESSNVKCKQDNKRPTITSYSS